MSILDSLYSALAGGADAARRSLGSDPVTRVREAPVHRPAGSLDPAEAVRAAANVRRALAQGSEAEVDPALESLIAAARQARGGAPPVPVSQGLSVGVDTGGNARALLDHLLELGSQRIGPDGLAYTDPVDILSSPLLRTDLIEGNPALQDALVELYRSLPGNRVNAHSPEDLPQLAAQIADEVAVLADNAIAAARSGRPAFDDSGSRLGSTAIDVVRDGPSLSTAADGSVVVSPRQPPVDPGRLGDAPAVVDPWEPIEVSRYERTPRTELSGSQVVPRTREGRQTFSPEERFSATLPHRSVDGQDVLVDGAPAFTQIGMRRSGSDGNRSAEVVEHVIPRGDDLFQISRMAGGENSSDLPFTQGGGSFEHAFVNRAQLDRYMQANGYSRIGGADLDVTSRTIDADEAAAAGRALLEVAGPNADASPARVAQVARWMDRVSRYGDPSVLDIALREAGALAPGGNSERNADAAIEAGSALLDRARQIAADIQPDFSEITQQRAPGAGSGSADVGAARIPGASWEQTAGLAPTLSSRTGNAAPGRVLLEDLTSPAGVRSAAMNRQVDPPPGSPGSYTSDASAFSPIDETGGSLLQGLMIDAAMPEIAPAYRLGPLDELQRPRFVVRDAWPYPERVFSFTTSPGSWADAAGRGAQGPSLGGLGRLLDRARRANSRRAFGPQSVNVGASGGAPGTRAVIDALKELNVQANVLGPINRRLGELVQQLAATSDPAARAAIEQSMRALRQEAVSRFDTTVPLAERMKALNDEQRAFVESLTPDQYGPTLSRLMAQEIASRSRSLDVAGPAADQPVSVGVNSLAGSTRTTTEPGDGFYSYGPVDGPDAASRVAFGQPIPVTRFDSYSQVDDLGRSVDQRIEADFGPDQPARNPDALRQEADARQAESAMNADFLAEAVGREPSAPAVLRGYRGALESLPALRRPDSARRFLAGEISLEELGQIEGQEFARYIGELSVSDPEEATRILRGTAARAEAPLAFRPSAESRSGTDRITGSDRALAAASDAEAASDAAFSRLNAAKEEMRKAAGYSGDPLAFESSPAGQAFAQTPEGRAMAQGIERLREAAERAARNARDVARTSASALSRDPQRSVDSALANRSRLIDRLINGSEPQRLAAIDELFGVRDPRVRPMAGETAPMAATGIDVLRHVAETSGRSAEDVIYDVLRSDAMLNNTSNLDSALLRGGEIKASDGTAASAPSRNLGPESLRDAARAVAGMLPDASARRLSAAELAPDVEFADPPVFIPERDPTALQRIIGRIRSAFGASPPTPEPFVRSEFGGLPTADDIQLASSQQDIDALAQRIAATVDNASRAAESVGGDDAAAVASNIQASADALSRQLNARAAQLARSRAARAPTRPADSGSEGVGLDPETGELVRIAPIADDEPAAGRRRASSATVEPLSREDNRGLTAAYSSERQPRDPAGNQVRRTLGPREGAGTQFTSDLPPGEPLIVSESVANALAGGQTNLRVVTDGRGNAAVIGADQSIAKGGRREAFANGRLGDDPQPGESIVVRQPDGTYKIERTTTSSGVTVRDARGQGFSEPPPVRGDDQWNEVVDAAEDARTAGGMQSAAEDAAIAATSGDDLTALGRRARAEVESERVRGGKESGDDPPRRSQTDEEIEAERVRQEAEAGSDRYTYDDGSLVDDPERPRRRLPGRRTALGVAGAAALTGGAGALAPMIGGSSSVSYASGGAPAAFGDTNRAGAGSPADRIRSLRQRASMTSFVPM